MRNRARPSELTCGYCLPDWLSADGLKSSTAGRVVWARAGTTESSRAVTQIETVAFIAIPLKVMMSQPIERPLAYHAGGAGCAGTLRDSGHKAFRSAIEAMSDLA